ncbi:MAG: hypothetical protein JXA10_09190, partial [Anaerolineae bacterium]|nr:hypothetical protein [Anaerolineae bacterium]
MHKLRIVTILLILALATPVLAAPTPANIQPAPALTEQTALDVARNLRPSVAQDDLMTDFEHAAAFLDVYAANTPDRPNVDPARQAQTTAEWTVLVHVAGDNNLEIAALGDINEMEAIGSSADVNIVVQVDRAEDYTDYDGDWTEGRRYYIQQDDEPRVITSPVVEHLGEINSGDADVWADFVIWGVTNYPAEKYMLVLWDHGGAWISHSSDEDSGDDMDLAEFTDALDRIKAETGVRKFEVIGFDMCLMAQLEVYQTIEPYANYGIGSEENEPGAGWFYLYLDELVKNPGMNGGQLGKYVVDYFMYYLEEVVGDEDVYGLGVVDLSESATMTNAINGFVRVANASPEAELSNIADARNNTISYGAFNDPQYQDVWSSVDLYEFADLLTQITRNEELQSAAEGIKRAIDSFVLYEQHVKALDGSHGVSIYFPRNFKAYKIGSFHERYPREAPPPMTSWINFLNVFHGTAEAVVEDAPGINIIETYPDVASIYNPAVVSMEVSGRDILRVNYVVSQIINNNERIALDYDYLVSRTTTGSGVQIVDWSDGVTQRTFTWGAEIPVLTDGTTSTFALIIPNQDNPSVGVVNGLYTAAGGGNPIEAQLVFDLTTSPGHSTALWGLNETVSGNLQPFEIQVEPGDTFQPLWL